VKRHASARWAVAVLAVSAVLLISMGGAIVAAPATLPLLFVALRRQALAGWLRGAAVAVSGLTVMEVAWALTYVAAGEAKPWIWLLPAAAGIAATAALTAARAAPPRPAQP
jgi:hypothetical protein